MELDTDCKQQLVSSLKHKKNALAKPGHFFFQKTIILDQ
jgi:hypothetical protein